MKESAISGFFYLIFCVCTAMIGYTIHSSVGWAFIDAWLCPLAWIKWLVCHQVNISIIKETFSFFFA